MSLIVVGCNHRSADLSVLERLAVPSDHVSKTLDELMGLEHVTEAAVLSTCNRVEVYAVVERFHDGLAQLRDWFSQRADIHPQDFDELHYAYHEDGAAAHLFAVAGGLDSMVVGERQIGLQVRQAGELARGHGSARRVLQRVFRQAVRVGRRLRTETDIDAGASSMVDVGLRAALDRQPRTLSDAAFAIVGAGKIGALTAEQLQHLGATSIAVWNRSPDKATRLAARLSSTAHRAERLEDALRDADLVVCTTGASEPVIDAELMDRILATRQASGPLVLLDLAVPRNVDPQCASLDGVEVVDIADVRELTDSGVTGEVLAAARGIVDEEAERFVGWTRGSAVEPTIRDLRAAAERIRSEEIDRLAPRLANLDQRERDAVEAVTRGIVNTLLHTPTVRLKQLAERGGGQAYADGLRDLFDLDD